MGDPFGTQVALAQARLAPVLVAAGPGVFPGESLVRELDAAGQAAGVTVRYGREVSDWGAFVLFAEVSTARGTTRELVSVEALMLSGELGPRGRVDAAWRTVFVTLGVLDG